MTIALANSNPVQSAGNGSGTVFGFPWKIFAATDLLVGFIVSGVYALQTGGYSVSGTGINGGGQVTFATPPAVGTTVDIRPAIPEIQPTDFGNLGQYLPENQTNGLDRLTRMVQDLARQVYTFGIHGPDNESIPWTALPNAAARANATLLFGPTGLPTLGVPVSGGTITQSAFNALFYGAPPYLPTPAEISAGAAIVSPQYAPYLSFRYMTAAQILSAQQFLTPSNGGVDCTAALQTLFNLVQLSGGGYGEVQQGGYCVSTVTLAHGGNWKFNESIFFGNATTPTKALFKYTGAFSGVYDLYLDAVWNSNYTAIMWWTSANISVPAQSNNFYNLHLQNGLLGILFGDLGGGLANAPQSENYIHGLHTRGVQNVIHSNQPLGFLSITGAENASSKNEWDINNPNFGAAWTLSGLAGGFGYVNGTYTDVPLTGGSGNGAYAKVIVTGGAVTAVFITQSGQNYVVGNVLSASAASIGGAGSGFLTNVATIGGYNYLVAKVLTNINGVVRYVANDIEKTDSNLGFGFLHPDAAGLAVTEIHSSDMEIASQNFELTSGRVVLRGQSGEYWSNGTAPWLRLNGSAGGTIQIDGLNLDKDPSQSGANQALIDLGASTGNWDISVSNADLANQLQLVFWNGNSSPPAWPGNINLRFHNVRSFVANGGTNNPTFPQISTSSYNLLDAIGTDNIGNDITTWYKQDFSGVGTIGLISDVPPGTTFLNSVQVTPAAGDASGVYSIDFTSLTTVKAKGVKCKPGDQFMLSGWFRLSSAGTGQVNAVFADSTGASHATSNLLDNTNLLTAAWQFLTVLFTAGTGSYYMGVGIQGTNGTPAQHIGIRLARPA